MDSSMHNAFTIGALTTLGHNALHCPGAGGFTSAPESASRAASTFSSPKLSSTLSPLDLCLNNSSTKLPQLLTDFNMDDSTSNVDWTRLLSLDCAWLHIFGQAGPKVPMFIADFPARCLGDALDAGLYATSNTVVRPQDALGAAFHHYQSHELLPQPDQIKVFNGMDYQMRATLGLLNPLDAFSNTGDGNIDEILIYLGCLERWQQMLTSGRVSVCYQLGVVTELVEDKVANYTAEVFSSSLPSLENVTIWLYHKLEFDAAGQIVHDFWSPFGDGSYHKPEQVQQPLTPHPPQGIFLDSIYGTFATQQDDQVQILAPTTRNLSLNVEAYTNSSSSRAQSQIGIIKYETPGPTPVLGLPTPPDSLALNKGKKRARSSSSSERKHSASPSPSQLPVANGGQLNLNLADPQLDEQQRRQAILTSAISVQDLMSPQRCPSKFIMDGAKVLTGSVILLIAKHYPNKEIYERINAILARDGFGPLRSANVITRRITVAIETYCKHRDVTTNVARKELEDARKNNQVVTGRGLGGNLGWTEPSSATTPTASTPTSTVQASDGEEEEDKPRKVKKIKLSKKKGEEKGKKQGKKRRGSVKEEESDAANDSGYATQDEKPPMQMRPNTQTNDNDFDSYLRLSLQEYFQQEEDKEEMAF